MADETPKATRRFKTSFPMRPKPRKPMVLPRTPGPARRRGDQGIEGHFPERTARRDSPMRRVAIRVRMRARSAVAWVRQWGVVPRRMEREERAWWVMWSAGKGSVIDGFEEVRMG